MIRSAFKAAGPGFTALFIFLALFKLALIGGLGYVAWHFLAKFW